MRDQRPPGAAPGRWGEELSATLSLAWPLILANLTQQVIQATDVLLMGRLGATQLAAATLALNLTFTFNLFLLGLLIASSPMMATAISAPHSTSQVRVLPSPPPLSPSAGRPKWPKISDQLSNALRPIPAMLSHRTTRGRSSAETKLRKSWNSSHGAVHHI